MQRNDVTNFILTFNVIYPVVYIHNSHYSQTDTNRCMQYVREALKQTFCIMIHGICILRICFTQYSGIDARIIVTSSFLSLSRSLFCFVYRIFTSIHVIFFFFFLIPYFAFLFIYSYVLLKLRLAYTFEIMYSFLFYLDIA